MYLEATPACLPLNVTNTNFIVVHLQVCDIFSLKYPKPYCPRGENVGQKGWLDEM